MKGKTNRQNLSLWTTLTRPHHIGRLSPELDMALKSAFHVIGLMRPWGLLRDRSASKTPPD